MICAINDCGRLVTARGLCRRHYLQRWRAGNVTELPTKDRGLTVCPDDHAHDLDTCWAQHGCRCDKCQHARKMERQRRRNRLRAYGRANEIMHVKVDAEPARKHVKKLQMQGGGLERIADAAGVPRSALQDLIFGRRGTARTGDPVMYEIFADYAQRILMLTIGDVDLPVLDATGTMRRLRALVWMGHTQSELARRLGWTPQNFGKLIMGDHEKVTVATYDRVGALFKELWNVQGRASHSDAARANARRRGWLSPLAWDDIDNDPAPPTVDVESGVDDLAVDLATEGRDIRLTPAERRVAVERLHSLRWSDGRIAETLHITSKTVMRIRRELGLESFEVAEIRAVAA